LQVSVGSPACFAVCVSAWIRRTKSAARRTVGFGLRRGHGFDIDCVEQIGTQQVADELLKVDNFAAYRGSRMLTVRQSAPQVVAVR
jgi:hypothetical protein